MNECSFIYRLQYFYLVTSHPGWRMCLIKATPIKE